MKGEVVTVVTMMGEVIGRLKEETTDGYVVESPRLFVPAQGESSGGFAPGLSMTGQQDLDIATINKRVTMTVLKSHEEIARAWSQATSGIVMP